jgi:hypothetical protein
VRRSSPALLLLPLLAAGCNQEAEGFPCPGSPVATFTFSGTLTLVSCAAGAPAAGINGLFPPTVSVGGTVTSFDSGTAAALCVTRPNAEPLTGTMAADTIDVSLETRGALLSGCNALCAVTVRQQVAGTLQRDPGGAPSGFTGTLVDEQTQDPTVAGADCAPCTTPCRATYALSALPTGTR